MRVNRYVRGQPGGADASSALLDFKQFPAWMWRNAVVRDRAPEPLLSHPPGRAVRRDDPHYETSALEPLDKGSVWSTGEAPETFPSGM